MTPHRNYSAPRWLRNPHLQSALSSMPMRRAGGLRALERTGAKTTEHIITYNLITQLSTRDPQYALHHYKNKPASLKYRLDSLYQINTYQIRQT